jgi:2-polyprenyl-6-methoxyphenol hydroxylase-like FAD-dependent oxidoreductase
MPDSPAATFERLSTRIAANDTQVLFRTAHVLGGGVAGSVAARVLADHAERVVIVEPDGAEAGSRGESRPGVPQGYQVHTLLPGGRAQLERFYPGIVDQAFDEGAVLAGPHDVVATVDGREQLTTPNMELVCSSRPFLESLIRQRTLALPNVDVVTARATGLDFERDAVAAVRYTSAGEEVVERTDFAVDATGRGSRLSDWLEQGGFPRPEMERLQVDVRYLTARFKRSHDWTGPWSGIARLSPARVSEGFVGAAVSAIEDQQWTVMLAYFGGGGGHLGADEFVAQCRELPPLFQEAVSGEPVGEPVPYRHPDSRWRHVEALDRFPARLAVVGDAVASFNPVYGQGMTSATLHASCLSEYLRSGPDLDAPARQFLDLQRVVVEAAWQTSTGPDAVILGVAPKPATLPEKLRAWAIGQVMAAIDRDVRVATVFREVSFMTAHPSALGAPDVLARAVLANWRARRAAPAAG